MEGTNNNPFFFSTNRVNIYAFSDRVTLLNITEKKMGVFVWHFWIKKFNDFIFQSLVFNWKKVEKFLQFRN